jgi:integrase
MATSHPENARPLQLLADGEQSEPTPEDGKQRRSKGEGALRQRPDGTWEATLDLGRVNGRRRRTAYRGRTKSEALAKRRIASAELARGRRVTNTRMTVASLVDLWLDTKVAAKVAVEDLKQKTADNYRDVAASYVKPILGDSLVRNLRTSDVDAMSTRMRKAGLSQNTIRLSRTVLKMALDYAITEEELISVNVVNGSVRPNVAISAEEHTTLSLKQAKHLLAKAPQTVFGILIGVALWTGMREGELVALRWEDVDFKGCRLMVTGTLGRVKGKGLVRTTPKTRASKAPVPLPAPVLQLLRRQLRQQQRQRAEVGDLWTETGFVFTLDVGQAIDGRRVLREWRTIQNDLGLPDMTVHELRHTTGTLLLNTGVPLEVVSAILRHASIRVTKDIYAKVEEPLARQGMDSFERALGKRRAS